MIGDYAALLGLVFFRKYRKNKTLQDCNEKVKIYADDCIKL
jgi:hypothetical protein